MEGKKGDGIKMSHCNYGTQNPSWIIKEAVGLTYNNNKETPNHWKPQ